MGEHFTGDKITSVDQSDLSSEYPFFYTVDRTCMSVDYLLFKGNHKNVTLKILCNNGQEVYKKSKLNIKGKYKFSMASIKNDFCDYENRLQWLIFIEDSKNQVLYRCEILGDECQE